MWTKTVADFPRNATARLTKWARQIGLNWASRTQRNNPKENGMQIDQVAKTRSLLRIEQVMERVQRGRSWIWMAVQNGAFPAPRRLSPRCTRWDSEAVDQWIAQQLDGGKVQR
ncbi:helix-turn-helix transcriptional regulator [Acidovorax temperans]|jgi:prophage regulatory protein